MATNKIMVDEGTTTNLATNSFSEDAVTKHVSRSVLNTSSGTETGTASNPLQVSIANTGSNSTAVKTDSSATTQPISAVSLPLPTGASTSAKQPALGTAGTPSSDVITVQGITSMTAIKVDGSGVTQPISGTVTVQQSTASSLKAEVVGTGTFAVQNSAATPAGTNAIGKLLAPDIDITTHTNYIRKYYTNAGAVTDGIVWSPAAGKRWHVVSMFINVSAAATVTLEDDKAGGDDAVWKAEFAANSGMTINFSDNYPLASGEDAADLIITTSAGNVYVTLTGYEI